jgi:hypothetical protein
MKVQTKVRGGRAVSGCGGRIPGGGRGFAGCGGRIYVA